jgi:hypothetical protein
MEHHAERAVEATVGAEHRAEDFAETRKEWMTPELRKFEISEITANGGSLSSDGIMSS